MKVLLTGKTLKSSAYTSVAKAEGGPDQASAINTKVPRIFGKESASRGALVLHYFPDCVIECIKPSPYVESATNNPRNVYGLARCVGKSLLVNDNPNRPIFALMRPLAPTAAISLRSCSVWWPNAKASVSLQINLASRLQLLSCRHQGATLSRVAERARRKFFPIVLMA